LALFIGWQRKACERPAQKMPWGNPSAVEDEASETETESGS